MSPLALEAGGDEQDSRDRRAERDAAEPVGLRPRSPRRCREMAQAERDQDGEHRRHQKDHAPGHELRQNAAECRSERAARADGRRDDAERSATSFGRDDARDHGDAEAGDGRRAERLTCACQIISIGNDAAIPASREAATKMLRPTTNIRRSP